jgi:hypothetical protein
MIIEQTKEQMREAIALHTGAAIKWIRLARSRVWSLSQGQMSEIRNVAFDIDFKPAAVLRHENWLTIETDFNFVVRSEAQVNKPILTVECQFEAQYCLVEGFDPSESQIQAFQAANAVFNCWPFFREYVQSTATRMNFPPPPVPFLRIVRKAEDPVPAEPHPSIIGGNQRTQKRRVLARPTERRLPR